MKKKYEGLNIKVVYTGPVNMVLMNSNVRLKAKTKVKDWEEQEVIEEFGIDGITTQDITTP